MLGSSSAVGKWCYGFWTSWFGKRNPGLGQAFAGHSTFRVEPRQTVAVASTTQLKARETRCNGYATERLYRAHCVLFSR